MSAIDAALKNLMAELEGSKQLDNSFSPSLIGLL
jgi:hypothetical protein